MTRLQVRHEDESGFTLQEILIVIAVASLLVSMGLSVVAVINKTFGQWRAESSLRASVNSAISRMAEDVRNSRAILAVSDSMIVISKDVGSAVTYRFYASGIKRNEVMLAGLDEPVLTGSVTVKTSPVGRKGGERYFLVQVTGERKNRLYSAQTMVTVPQSSAVSFLSTNKRY